MNNNSSKNNDSKHLASTFYVSGTILFGLYGLNSFNSPNKFQEIVTF